MRGDPPTPPSTSDSEPDPARRPVPAPLPGSTSVPTPPGPGDADGPHRAAPVPEPPPEHILKLIGGLLDRIPHFFYVHDANLRFQYANQAAADYFGRDKADLVGLRHRDVDGSEQGAFIERTFRPIIDGGEPLVVEKMPFRRPDGGEGYLRAHIVPFDHPATGQRMMLGLSSDITADVAQAALERELDIARRVQQSLLPRALPTFGGVQIEARCEPAAFVGGDFYDVFVSRNGRLRVLVGDVTGHGVGSALIAAACRAYARVVFADEIDLDAGIAELDRLVAADVTHGDFVTFAVAEVDPGGRTLRYRSAGHGPVLHLPAGGTGPATLPSHVPPLGLGLAAAHGSEPTTVLDLAPGDRLLIPSDGLFEGRNAAGDAFGVDRMTDAAVAGGLARLFDAESTWRGDRPAGDDRTALMLAAE